MATDNQTYVRDLTSDDPATWVDKYGDSLFRYALSKVGERDTAEDLVQESLLAALNGLDSFNAKSPTLTWLIGILRRKIVDEFRRRECDGGMLIGSAAIHVARRRNAGGHRHSHEQLANWPVEPDAVLERNEFWEVLDDCVTSLPPHFAAVFVLRDMQHEDTDTVCERLEISRANLFVRLHRARLILRQCLEAKWFEGTVFNSS